MKVLLSRPFIYELYQSLIDGRRARRIFAREYIQGHAGERILEVGCGTGLMYRELPKEISYVGIDIDAKYVQMAQRKYQGGQIRFMCTTIEEAGELGRFDKILLCGVLHHLDDHQSSAILGKCSEMLTEGGRLYTLDGVIHEEQSPISRKLVVSDRGQYIRDRSGYARLINRHFKIIKDDIRTDTLRIPYSQFITVSERTDVPE